MTGTLKNPAKCLWRWEPDRRSNFFFSPPAHLCAVTYMTEISLIVRLNNKFNSTTTPLAAWSWLQSVWWGDWFKCYQSSFWCVVAVALSTWCLSHQISRLNEYICSLCPGHWWLVRLAKQGALNPRHLVSPLVCWGTRNVHHDTLMFWHSHGTSVHLFYNIWKINATPS